MIFLYFFGLSSIEEQKMENEGYVSRLSGFGFSSLNTFHIFCSENSQAFSSAINEKNFSLFHLAAIS